MTNTELTADTITNKQIRALRDEAVAAGDDRQVSFCNIALGESGPHPLHLVARAICVRVINAAKASAVAE